MISLYNGDCEEIMRQLKSNDVQVDCIVVDLPYFRVVN